MEFFMSRLERELNKVIAKNKLELSIFIKKKLKSIPFAMKNRKELVRLLPIIIANTNMDNCNWMNNAFFVQESNFLDILIDNINNFPMEEKNGLLYKVFSIFDFLILNENQAKKVIDKLLESNYQLDTYIIESLYNVIQRDNPKVAEYMLKKYITDPKLCNACIPIVVHEEKKLRLFHQNIDFILEHIKEFDLYMLKHRLKEEEEVVLKIKNKIEENKKENVTTIVRNLYQNFLNIGGIRLEEETTKQMETILEVVYLLVEDICKNEGTKVSDMEILNSGTFSTALRIGDKVIKIGCKRGTKTFPNNPYVNAMLLRKDFPLNENISLFVEVSERVDTNTEITEEELYQLYKKVRDLHLVWFDVTTRNVGRLLKDNTIHWRQDLTITDERLGLQPMRGNEVLKAGEIVILDNDFICDENDISKEIAVYATPLQKKFEARYQQEKRMEITSNQEELEQPNLTASQEIVPKKR